MLDRIIKRRNTDDFRHDQSSFYEKSLAKKTIIRDEKPRVKTLVLRYILIRRKSIENQHQSQSQRLYINLMTTFLDFYVQSGEIPNPCA